MAFNEIDPLMALELSGVKTYHTEEEVYAARLSEWFITFEGDIYGDPGWGNTLPQFKHEPIGESHVQAKIEATLLKKLAQDLPSIPISGLQVMEGDEADIIRVIINIKGTTITVNVKLSDEYTGE